MRSPITRAPPLVLAVQLLFVPSSSAWVVPLHARRRLLGTGSWRAGGVAAKDSTLGSSALGACCRGREEKRRGAALGGVRAKDDDVVDDDPGMLSYTDLSCFAVGPFGHIEFVTYLRV